jgi:Transmembrane secretion effector
MSRSAVRPGGRQRGIGCLASTTWGFALRAESSTSRNPPRLSESRPRRDRDVRRNRKLQCGRAKVSALDELQHERLRDGAGSWGTFEDTSQSVKFLETFLVASWTEHLRQHQRVTNADPRAPSAHNAAASGGIRRYPISSLPKQSWRFTRPR